MVKTAARALRQTTVRDVMRIHMVTVVPEMTVRELAQTLVDAGIRSAPVLDPAGKIVGVASQADVIAPRARDTRCASSRGGCACGVDGLRVRDVMGPVGPVISPDEPLPRLVRRFVRERVQRALVVENGMLLGIVTPIDILGAIDEAA
jgi:CBS-domain-containing membrane protein